MYYSKIHRREGAVILAVCDAEAHNKTFEDDKLSFFVDPSFYGKKGISEEKLMELLEEATIINLAGRLCVDLAIRSGYVELENVLDIGGCSHAQIVRI
jgi:hypothetical protein